MPFGIAKGWVLPGVAVVGEARECPLCGGTKWILFDGHKPQETANEGALPRLPRPQGKIGARRVS